MDTLKLGSRWDQKHNKIYIDEEQLREDVSSGCTNEKVTLRVWRMIASSIIKGITFTTEGTDDKCNNMVPVLDFQCRIIRKETMMQDPQGSHNKMKLEVVKKIEEVGNGCGCPGVSTLLSKGEGWFYFESSGLKRTQPWV